MQSATFPEPQGHALLCEILKFLPITDILQILVDQLRHEIILNLCFWLYVPP